MAEISTDGFASVCEIRHWSLGQKINDFFLTVYEGADETLFCAGQWDREHSGQVLQLEGLRSVMVPVIERPSGAINYTNLDLRLLDAEYRDAHGRLVESHTKAVTVHSQVFVPQFSPELMRWFMLNAEGKGVLPGHTEFAEASVPYDVAKAIHTGAKVFSPQAPVFERRMPERFDGVFPPIAAHHSARAKTAVAVT